MMTAFRLTTITLLLAVFSNSAATLYVSLGSTNPTPPYTNWATAATNIQDAIEASADGDLILVTSFWKWCRRRRGFRRPNRLCALEQSVLLRRRR